MVSLKRKIVFEWVLLLFYICGIVEFVVICGSIWGSSLNKLHFGDNPSIRNYLRSYLLPSWMDSNRAAMRNKATGLQEYSRLIFWKHICWSLLVCDVEPLDASDHYKWRHFGFLSIDISSFAISSFNATGSVGGNDDAPAALAASLYKRRTKTAPDVFLQRRSSGCWSGCYWSTSTVLRP